VAEACRIFRAHPASLRLIRDFVREQAGRSNLEAIADDLVLAASEAAGNAIVHSSGDQVEVEWRKRPGDVEIEVRDRGVFKRRVRLPFAEGGRGIFVMMSLMDEVTIREGRPDRPGTVVRLRKRDPQPASWTA
jgi:anti-sigma regulatory factor (Ser/Thr protein kinase)